MKFQRFSFYILILIFWFGNSARGNEYDQPKKPKSTEESKTTAVAIRDIHALNQLATYLQGNPTQLNKKQLILLLGNAKLALKKAHSKSHPQNKALRATLLNTLSIVLPALLTMFNFGILSPWPLFKTSASIWSVGIDARLSVEDTIKQVGLFIRWLKAVTHPEKSKSKTWTEWVKEFFMGTKNTGKVTFMVRRTPRARL